MCGDFNAEPNAPEMEIISRDSSFNNLTKDIGITFHGYYKNDPNDPPCSIDYIVLKGDWQCEQYINGQMKKMEYTCRITIQYAAVIKP